MSRLFVFSSALLFPSLLMAGTDWKSVEGWMPDRCAAVMKVQFDRESRTALLESLPIDPDIVNKALDEQSAAFAKMTGVNLLDSTELVLAVAVSERHELLPVLGLRLPIDRTKTLETIRTGPLAERGFMVTESPMGIVLERGRVGFAFTTTGVLLCTAPNMLADLVRRNGAPSATNGKFIEGATSSIEEPARLTIRIVPPSWIIPALFVAAHLETIGLGRDVWIRLQAVSISITADDLISRWEFQDGETAETVEKAVRNGLDLVRTRLSDLRKKAEEESDELGVLSLLSPTRLAAATNAATFEDGARQIVFKSVDGSLLLRAPLKALAPLKRFCESEVLGMTGPWRLTGLRNIFRRAAKRR